MTSKLNWVDPREYAATLEGEENLVLFYSGMTPGRNSFLAWELTEKLTDLNQFEKNLGTKKWFGYFGYGLRTQFENYSRAKKSIITLPDFLMMSFKNILIFDHETKTISSPNPTFNVKSLTRDSNQFTATAHTRCEIKELKSNMTDAEYLSKAKTIIEKIHAGDLYQANLTRKFYGEFKTETNSFGMFCQLTEISPAPYSAFIKFDGIAVISASPEMFLKVQDGIITSKPIKGTLSSNFPASQLANSEKDKAENLMIVDLMRNDLARSADDVKVQKLFEITSYAKYHHMSSTITGKLKTNAIDAVKNCFPPGSMTGAPKIAAVELCAEMEELERGIYSGALGYFAENGDCDLSVVIRTLIIKGKEFEFQVGGGIVADSIPEKELDEIYVKAKPIMEILNVKS